MQSFKMRRKENVIGRVEAMSRYELFLKVVFKMYLFFSKDVKVILMIILLFIHYM